MSLSLEKNSFYGQRSGPVVVVVMDGVGLGPDYEGNAVRLARTPCLDYLYKNSLWTPLAAHGKAVGMPSDADMGNSEVGHNALGAGRIFDQGAKLVEEAIRSGSMFADTAWNEVITNVTDKQTCLHFIGLFSDGNVHSHIDHLKAMILEAKKKNVAKVAVHALIDGRDVGETTALDYTEPFEAWLAELDPAYGVASGGGRMVITMDRYGAEWDMVKRGWETHVLGEGQRFPSLSDAIKGIRAQNPSLIDQNLPPFVIEREGKPFAPIHDGDSVVFFNFRGDRSIEISQAFTGGDVPFDRQRQPDVVYAGMMQYDGDENIPDRYLVAPPVIKDTLGEYLAANGIGQLACSETQKYGHVTYFWNGNKSGYFDQSIETYDEIPSDLIPFEQRPWMKAAEITDKVIARLREKPNGFARLNFANGDMVGHTGNLQSAIISVETVDICLARLLPAIKEMGGILLITADHGNADEMYEIDKKTGKARIVDGVPKAKTSHTLNQVPFIIYDPVAQGDYSLSGTDAPGLSNVAATALNLMGFEAPEEFRPSLIAFK